VPSNSSINQSTQATTVNLNSSTNNVNSLMMKSISSNSGDLESSLSLSASNQAPVTTLKRTYMYALVCARTATITFYCFTTETATHDAIRQLLDTVCENLLQRFHLANNTVLYKFGGLIGDALISDLKKVKALTLTNTHNELASHRQQPSMTNYPPEQQLTANPSGASNISDFKTVKKPLHSTTSTPNSVMAANKKLASSPKFQRYPSYKGPVDTQGGGGSSGAINPAFIANLQFSANPSGAASGSYQSISTLITSPPNTLASLLAFKQIYIIVAHCKPYDSINSLVNQQVHFCAQFLTGASSSASTVTPAPTPTSTGNTLASAIDSGASQSPLTSSNTNFTTINRQNSSTGQQLSLNPRLAQ
jgi:hypothetical protein